MKSLILHDQVILDENYYSLPAEQIYQHQAMQIKLYKFQLKAIKWMLQREFVTYKNECLVTCQRQPFIPREELLLEMAQRINSLSGGMLCDEVIFSFIKDGNGKNTDGCFIDFTPFTKRSQ
jgi:hypothetical protein